ncbi:NACHT domain-containing protein [Streptomyces sp. HD]|uniref:NACHT domain-containing protein n=1 Tax=Streptomyces sp. HD TaxID=3020892 RepID=UPI00232EA03A|nr:HEAT repeat domain-containing protein [Streptomyces sp. HD]MDC0767363.1 HEAT repeat domain-containing protein [Streptomyces sp. HD]
MVWKPKRVGTAAGERSVGAAGDVKAAATGDNSSATYTHIENQYLQPPVREAAELSPEKKDEALRRYSIRIRETYGRLDLDVLIPTEEGEHPPVGLDEVFVAPTVRADPPPVELPRDIRQRLVDAGEWPSSLPPGLEREALERARRAYADRPARDVLEVLADPGEHRIVLLGDPGAGKSTLARHLALALTQEMPAGAPLEPLAGRMPLVVELREYAAGEWRERTFEEFLRHLHGTKGMAPPVPVVERLLAEGRAVVVFDGLDELFDPAAREQVGHRIADFAGRYGDAGVRVVVTSRVIGYRRGVLDSAGFAHYMIQDLSKEQIRRFAGQWYGTAYPNDTERADRLCRRLTEAVGYSRPVGELAGNPLLLTILAIIGRRRELPRDRQGVYRHAVAVLVAHWDEHAKNLRAPTDVEALSYLGDEDRHELLRLVARRMQDGDGGIAGNHIHQDELLDTFKEYLREQYELPVSQAVSAARTMVRQFRERNFILSHYGGGVYGFAHRAFLEYLAAVDIDRRYTREREWTPEEFIEEVFARRAEDPAWHEVLLLVVGQIGEREAGAAVDRLLEMHRRRVDRSWEAPLLVLALRALAEVRRIGALAAQSRAVVDAMIALAEETHLHHIAIQTEGIEQALAMFPPHWSGRSRYLRWFHLRGQFVGTATTGECAARLYQRPAIQQVMAVHSPNRHARAALLKELAERWGTERDVRELIRISAVADGDPSVRGTALALLPELGALESGIKDLMADRSMTDPSLQVRALALALRGDTEPHDLWAPLADLTVSADSESRRVAALSALALYRSKSREVRALLARQAVEAPEGQVRAEALRGLGDVLDDERVAALMRSRAIEDPHPTARHMALNYLTQCCGDWEIARRLAVEDEDGFVRSQALFSLGDLRSDDPETWHLARLRAVEDPSKQVRAAACSMLWKLVGDQTDTWEFLRDRVAAESSASARRAALYGLVRLRGNEAETWELVRALAVGDPEQELRADAVAYLCGRRGDDASTWALVFDRLKNDPGTQVQWQTLLSLRHYQGDETVKWETIRGCVNTGSAFAIRLQALALLAMGRGDDALTHALIKDLATSNAAPSVRADAVRWYAVCAPDESAVEFLRGHAVGSPYSEDRTAALQSLAYGWPAHPATLPFLREHADADTIAAAEALAPLADQLP